MVSVEDLVPVSNCQKLENLLWEADVGQGKFVPRRLVDVTDHGTESLMSCFFHFNDLVSLIGPKNRGNNS